MSEQTFEQMLEPLQARFIEVAAPRIVAKERAAANVQIKDLYPNQPAPEATEEVVAEETIEEVTDEPVVEDVVEETVEEIEEEGEDDAVAVDVEVTP